MNQSPKSLDTILYDKLPCKVSIMQRSTSSRLQPTVFTNYYIAGIIVKGEFA